MKHFKISEFDSPDVIGSGSKMKRSTLNLLERCREFANIPFVITSGYRTKSHNKRVGGVQSSSHTKGYAVDISCRNSSDRFKIIDAAIKVGFHRIGVSGNFIHLDNDPQKKDDLIWTY